MHTAASHNTLLRLESCERVFCSQTLAATPVLPAGARMALGSTSFDQHCSS